MLSDKRTRSGPVSFFALAAACLLFPGCGALPGPAGGMPQVSVPFGWNFGKDSLTRAVENDPFPEAAEVDLEI